MNTQDAVGKSMGRAVEMMSLATILLLAFVTVFANAQTIDVNKRTSTFPVSFDRLIDAVRAYCEANDYSPVSVDRAAGIIKTDWTERAEWNASQNTKVRRNLFVTVLT
jgi:hypothetical protein